MIAAGNFAVASAVRPPVLSFIGLRTYKPSTEDYVPLLPWAGVTLLGVALAARSLTPRNAAALARVRPPRAARLDGPAQPRDLHGAPAAAAGRPLACQPDDRYPMKSNPTASPSHAPLVVAAAAGHLEVPRAARRPRHPGAGPAGRRHRVVHELLARLLRRRAGAGRHPRLDGHLRLRRRRQARRQLHADRGRVGRRHERDGRADPGDGVDGPAAAAGVAADPLPAAASACSAPASACSTRRSWSTGCSSPFRPGSRSPTSCAR